MAPGVATRQDEKTEDSRGSQSLELELATLSKVPLLVAEIAPVAQLASRLRSARSAVSVESDEKQGDNGSESAHWKRTRMHCVGSAGGGRFMAVKKAFRQATICSWEKVFARKGR